jgi:short-subunit dehydrogenase
MATGQLIITGVSSGIGLALAKEGIKRDWFVQGIGRDEPKELFGKERWSFVQADLSREESVETLPFMRLKVEGPTVLINNAGTLGPVNPATENEWKEISRAFTLNVTAPMRLTARFLHKINGEKQVYFTGSGAAEHPIHGWSVYCASKAALHQYAQVLAQEHPTMRVHAFRPGKVDTPMQAQIRGTAAEDFPMVQHFVEEYEQGKLVRPETVAETLMDIIESKEQFPVIFSLSNYSKE